jgi:hypothetical protein
LASGSFVEWSKPSTWTAVGSSVSEPPDRTGLVRMVSGSAVIVVPMSSSPAAAEYVTSCPPTEVGSVLSGVVETPASDTCTPSGRGSMDR